MSRRQGRDPLQVAVLGVVVLVVAVLGVFHLDSLPFGSGRTTTYRAAFSDAGGLKPGDPVEISGIRVGEVRDIGVRRTHVVVEFRVRHAVRLGTRSHASVKVGSLLGAKFLEVEPAGVHRMGGGDEIPLDRTTPAYDVVAAFDELTETTEKIDKDQVARALDTITETFRGAPEQVRGAVRGLADLTSVIADRSDAVKDLLRHARVTTTVLARRRGDVRSLLAASDLLLGELDARRSAIHRLLTTTSALARGLDGLIDENQASLTPALKQLRGVIDTLSTRQDQLALTIRNMDNYTQVFVNAVGNGPWFDGVISNLPTKVSIGTGR